MQLPNPHYSVESSQKCTEHLALSPERHNHMEPALNCSQNSRESFEPCSLTIKDIYFFYLSQAVKFLDSFSLMMSQTHVHH